MHILKEHMEICKVLFISVHCASGRVICKIIFFLHIVSAPRT